MKLPKECSKQRKASPGPSLGHGRPLQHLPVTRKRRKRQSDGDAKRGRHHGNPKRGSFEKGRNRLYSVFLRCQVRERQKVIFGGSMEKH